MAVAMSKNRDLAGLQPLGAQFFSRAGRVGCHGLAQFGLGLDQAPESPGDGDTLARRRHL